MTDLSRHHMHHLAGTKFGSWASVPAALGVESHAAAKKRTDTRRARMRPGDWPSRVPSEIVQSLNNHIWLWYDRERRKFRPWEGRCSTPETAWPYPGPGGGIRVITQR